MTAQLPRPPRARAAAALLACATTAALLAAAQPAAAQPAAAQPARAAGTAAGQAGFARSWSDSVAVPAFPARGGGAQPGVGGRPYAISNNGRFVVAAAPDAEGNAGVAVRDRRTGRQRIVVPTALGIHEPGYPDWAGIDDSGTRLVLQTMAVEDDRAYELGSLIDLTAGTVEDLGPLTPIALSADGRSLAYQIWDYYGMDYGSGVQSLGGGPSGGWSHDPLADGSLSIAGLAANGRCAVVNRSGEDNAETGNASDGYLEDLPTHTHRVITVDKRGTPVGGSGAAVSGDCSTVAFWTAAELVPGVGGDGVQHLFVRRLATGRTSAVLVDGVPVSLPAGGAKVQLDTTGRQVSVLWRSTSDSPRRLTVSAVPAGPTVDITVPDLVDAVMSGDGRTALLFIGEPYNGGQLLVRERVWP